MLLQLVQACRVFDRAGVRSRCPTDPCGRRPARSVLAPWPVVWGPSSFLAWLPCTLSCVLPCGCGLRASGWVCLAALLRVVATNGCRPCGMNRLYSGVPAFPTGARSRVPPTAVLSSHIPAHAYRCLHTCLAHTCLHMPTHAHCHLPCYFLSHMFRSITPSSNLRYATHYSTHHCPVYCFCLACALLQGMSCSPSTSASCILLGLLRVWCACGTHASQVLHQHRSRPRSRAGQFDSHLPPFCPF